MKNFFSTYRNDNTAAAAIEFALVGTTFIIMILGIVELGRYMFTWNSLQYALEQATRYALVREDAPLSEVEEYAVSQMPSVLVSPDDLDIDISHTSTSGVDFIELTGDYDYKIFAAVLPGGLFIDSDLRVNVSLPVQ